MAARLTDATRGTTARLMRALLSALAPALMPAARAIIACVLIAAAGDRPLHAQASETPSPGGVPYVPTPWPVVKAMLELAEVKAGDFLIDLGSGDGRIVIEAARTRGARGLGVELDPDLVRLSIDEARRLGVAKQAQFARQDLFETDLTPATVITMYLLPRIIAALQPRLSSQLRPGTRIVSHDFLMGDWKPDAQTRVDLPDKSFGPPYSMLYLWIVPAFVTGVWEGTVGEAPPESYRLELRQQFQQLSGTLHMRGRSGRIDRAVLAGDRVTFSAIIGQGKAAFRHGFDGRSVAGELVGTWTMVPVVPAGAVPATGAPGLETRARRIDAPGDSKRRY